MHHDSITGTAKRYVDDDYMRRITAIEDSVKQLFQSSFEKEIFYVNEYLYLQGLKMAQFKNNEGIRLALFN